MLLVSACILAGTALSSAQDASTATQQQQLQQLQQQIDQLQKLLELQQQVQQLQQQTGQQVQPQQSLQPQQAQPQWPLSQQPQFQGQLPAHPAPPQVTILSPVDTGLNIVTFTLGADDDDSFGDPARFAVKTNLLYSGATLTPNLAFEAGVGPRTSIELSAGYNPWSNLWDNAGKGAGPDYDADNTYKRKLDHIFGKAEFRYWFKERFDSHYVGANLFYADYNVGELKVPLLFDGYMTDYDGNAFGGGVTYGYLWRWSRSWAMEFSAAVGLAVMGYDKSVIEADSTGYNLIDATPYRKTYFGPTSVGIKLVFTIK
jgi:hypothetical protein